ncbi:hypothetical protein ASD11_04205 [Aeromicrobium sp. Root495]|nr:hypothetical protein ASD11_04205 [Aeromicrobium sp. Root495]
MVERIVASGRAVLARDGYDLFSTNRVAEAAGVSPGSLYQYFPDKSAILEVIVDRYLQEVSDRVTAALADQLGKPPAELARGTVDALLAAIEADPVLLRVVHEELPGRQVVQARRAMERRVRELARAALTLQGAEPGRDTAMAAWVVVHAMEALSVQWVLDPPDATREQVVEELAGLAENYLSGRTQEPGPAPR